MKRIAVLLAIGVGVAAALSAQTSVKATGSIETAEQLVSTKTTGAPLAVSSSTMVPNLNADQVDGFEGAVLDSRLTNAETLLLAVQDQVNALGVAKVPETGQTTCYDAAGTVIGCGGTGQDGESQLGVTWPNPRFTDNSDGTVTDNLTGLIWLANANCTDPVGGIDKNVNSPPQDPGELTWANALTWSNALAHGDCGLSDGSSAGAWRLPNVREFLSLVHYGFVAPALPNTAGTGQWTEGEPFSGIKDEFWTSTTPGSGVTSNAWTFYTVQGFGNPAAPKTIHLAVWPVKGGQ